MKNPCLSKGLLIFSYDLDIRRRGASGQGTGIQYLCGIDEAGRGPLAGPVVAAALILPQSVNIDGLNDSKKLSAQKRLSLEKEIMEKALAYGVGMADVQEIARLNILQATFLAMKRAVHALPLVPDYILVDGRDFPRFVTSDKAKLIPGRAVVGGDGKSACIAGASVLAKVQRDRMMVEYARQFPQYGFEQHKGYGTAEHRSRILQFGPCPIHREKFLRKILEAEKTSGV